MNQTQENPARGITIGSCIGIVLWAMLGTLVVTLATGCTVAVTPAERLFGDAQKAPKILIEKKTPLWGLFGSAKAEAGGEFAGHALVDFDPVTGAYHVDANVAHNPVTVIDANGRLIASMEPTRMADIAASVEKTQAIKEIWLAGFKAAESVGGAALTSFLGKSAAAFPETGGLPPGVDLSMILNALKPVTP